MNEKDLAEYYRYIIEQLDFCEMITSIFKEESWDNIPKVVGDMCRELADKIRKNLECI